ncbi:MAG: AAA family ATPase [Candidatus Micrarchaeota archaeon]|nr:AAA family ATPase [Candidatus Micrarchaeota archaeon]MDE1804713.1 AAA family ATPase [Candidatus Micrarchaeota archaeon]MDE1847131.1 AAA family ATPase [Candidatus Micrarchaeota archaeon]
MGRTIVFVGTPGAGKTSILNEVDHDHRLVNIGTEMFNIASKDHNVTNRDQLRKLDAKLQAQIRSKVFEEIRKAKEDIILDTHATIRNGPRFVFGFTMDELKSIDVRTLVYVDASSKDILKRREHDLSRHRDVEDATDIEEQREVNISLITAYAAVLGIPLYIIKNNSNQLKKAIEQANSIVKETFQ